ncbi:MAG: beta strand repeat-containing protein, partial [Betaproteobacteria bacterium]
MATRQTSPASTAALKTRPTALAVAVAGALIAAPQFSFALPTGGQVVAGQATISQPAPGSMQIDQGTAKAILNWQSFSIGSTEAVNFSQPSASAIALNRVLGNNPSEIFGRLAANGQVFLVNPSGILFGRSASVDVGSLVATTLSISDQDFLNGRYVFSNAGAAGSVRNEGSIITANGYTALMGPQVSNDGLIAARLGSVTLAAADRVSLDMIGDGLISVSVDQAALNASAINSGRIEADGGHVLLTARSANALLDTVVNNSGVIRANSLVERNGEIVLDGGSAGVVSVTGTLQAAGVDAGTTGGTVTVLGQYVGLFDNATINASGDAGGGTVLVGGNFQGKGPEQAAFRTYVGPDATISADGVAGGNGGKVIVWADDATRFYGSIKARGGAQEGNGGFVEVSGKGSLAFNGTVDASAPNGEFGELLLDPTNIVVVTVGAETILLTDVDNFTDADVGGGGDTKIAPATINAALANVTLQANNDITFTDAVSIVAAGVSLTAQAGRSILINNSITTNAAPITLVANETTVNGVQDGARSAGAATISMAAGTTLTSGGNDIALTVSTGAGLTNSTSGDITLAGMNAGAGHVLVRNVGPTAGSGIVRVDGAQLITAASAALDVNGAGGGGETGASGSPIRVTVTNLEARSQSGGAFFSSPTQGVTIGGATLGGLTGISTSSNGNIEVVADVGNIASSEAVSANGAGTVLLDATAANATITIQANGDVDSGSGLITLRADGDIVQDIGGTVGAATTGSITIHADQDGSGAGTLTANAAIGNPAAATAGTITLRGADVGLVAAVDGSGALVLEPSTDASSIGIGGGAGTFNVGTADVANLSDGFSGITIGRATGTHVVTINAVTFTDPTTIRAPGVGGTIAVNGQISGTDNASITLDGPAATITLAADIVTEGDAITLDDNVVIAEGTSVTLNTTAGVGNAAGAAVDIQGSLDGTAGGGTETLSINAGTGGGVTINSVTGSTGGTNPLNLTITDSGSTAVTGNASLVTLTLTDTTGAITFNGNLTATTLNTAAQGYSVVLNGASNTITNTVTFSNTGGVTLGNENTDSTTFNGGVTSTASTTSTAGTISTSDDAIVFGAVTLGASTTLDTNAATTAGDITLGAVTGGSNALTLETGAGVANADVTGTALTNVGTLTIQNMGGTASFTGTATTGAISVTATANNVSLTGNGNTASGAASFANTGTLTLGQAAGTQTYNGGLSTTGVGGVVTLNGTIASSDD